MAEDTPDGLAIDLQDPPYEDYQGMIVSLGHAIVLYEEQDTHAGDAWYLLRDGDRFGILEFGWGSCAGCDAFIACETAAEYEALRERLRADVRWGSAAETLAYLRDHDWEGSWSGDSEECARFRARAEAVLIAEGEGETP